jgi:ubiquinone/menaquinone biosynthesis C-methylase UbiE
VTAGTVRRVSLRVVDEEMRAYYDRRAPEYDDWWLGTGMFATRERPGWEDEVERILAVVRALPPVRVLDVACGTGFFTRHLRGEVTGLDQSPAMVEVASARMPGARVIHADAVPLPFSDGAFDLLLTGHFYGHLRPAERAVFLGEARRVASRIVVVDTARGPGSPAEEDQERELNDGSRHRVYKRFLTGGELAEELGGGEILHDGRWFVAVAS